MKKFLLLLLVMVLASAAALSEGTGSPFIDSLEEALRSYDLDRNGFRVGLSAEGQDFSAAFRYDREQGIADIDLEQYGRLQLDSGKAVYLNSGTPFVLDYSQLTGIFAGIRNPGDLARMLESRFNAIAAKAMKHLVNPFVEYEYSGNRFSMHLDIDTRKLKSQLVPFLQDLMQDETIQALYPIAAQALRNENPRFPQNAGDFPKYIVSMIPDDENYQGRLTGDLRILFSRGYVTDIVFSGDYHYGYSQWQGTYPLYFELSLSGKEPFIYLTGDTPSGGVTFRLEGNRFRFETRMFDRKGSYFSIDGTYDRETGEVSAVICDSSGDMTGDITGTMLRDRLDLNIRYYYDVIHVYARRGDRYIYGKVDTNASGTAGNYEVWIGEGPDRGYCIRIHGFNPVSWTDDACSLIISNSGLDLQFIRNGKGVLSVLAKRDPESGEIDISGELNDYGRPYRLHLAGAGEDYRLEFSYPYVNWHVEGKGDIRFSPGCLLQSAVCDVTVSEYTGWEEYNGYTDRMQYALERTEDTAEKMVYRLRKDAEVLWQLEMGLQDGGGTGKALTVRVLRGENPLFAASVMPIEKEPVVPIDITNAAVITPETIGIILQSMIR